MPDPPPVVPPLRYDHAYDMVLASTVAPGRSELPFDRVRAQLAARSSEGWELAHQALVTPSYPSAIAVESTKFVLSGVVPSDAGAFGVALTFKRSNADARDDALRRLAAIVEQQLTEISDYKATVIDTIDSKVTALSQSVRAAIEEPIREAVKAELVQRIASLETAVEELRSQ